MKPRLITASIVLLCALALCIAGSFLYTSSARSRPNVILITVESLRTDHIGCYSGNANVTPAIDALAAESVVYSNAHSVTSWTLASHASIFTGLYPSAHQAIHPLDELGDSYQTLAEVLDAADYQTAGIASGPYLRRVHNLDQGFQIYDDRIAARTSTRAHAAVTNPAMLARLKTFLRKERDPDRPFFLFAYFWDPHYDYVPPAPYDHAFVTKDCTPIDVRNYVTTDTVNASTPPDQLAYVKSQYDGEIRWTDDHLLQLFQLLIDEGLWDDTMIILTSDHGEEFFEHGMKGHRNNLFVESEHVPLVIKYPNGERRGRDDRLVSLVDIFPTVLDVASCANPPPCQGRSLLEKPVADRSIFYELSSVWYSSGADKTRITRRQDWFGVRNGDDKLIEIPDVGRRYLYDERKDPGERHNLAESRPALVRKLHGILKAERRRAALFKKLSGESTADLGDAELQELRSLGYLRF